MFDESPAETTVTTEQQPEPAQPETPAAAESASPQSFDAEYVAKLRSEAAKYRTQAKENAAAAARLAEIEEANKSAEQKQAEALARLQQENEALKAQALKAQVAASKGVPAELLAGTTEDELTASADALLAFRGASPPPDFGGGQRGDNLSVAEQLQRDLAKATEAGNVALQVTLKRRIAALAQT